MTQQLRLSEKLHSTRAIAFETASRPGAPCVFDNAFTASIINEQGRNSSHVCFLFFNQSNLSTCCIGSETWLCLTNHLHAAVRTTSHSELTDSAVSFFRILSTPRRSRVKAIFNAPLKRVKICAANSIPTLAYVSRFCLSGGRNFWFVE